MTPLRTLAVFTTLLGNKATAQRLQTMLANRQDLDLTCVVLEPADYRRYPAPRWARATDAWEGQHIARQKATPVLSGKKFDCLWLNAWELAVEFGDLSRQVPTVLLLDSVPATIDAQLRRRGVTGWKRRLSYVIHHRSFRRAANSLDIFLPMASDCAEALVDYYGIPRDSMFVTLAPQDTEAWRPELRNYSRPLRLLFAGNDFARKGGDLLLELFRDHLNPDDFRLTIASNDPRLESFHLPAGAEWLKGLNRDELREVYQRNDLFVFPTMQDYMPQVLAEALTMGLPCMANDVGGIRDLVLEGRTGFLMRTSDGPAAWAQRLIPLARNPGDIAKLSASARLFAEERLNLANFGRIIDQTLTQMRELVSERRKRNSPPSGAARMSSHQ